MVQRYNILGRHTNQYSCLCSHAWSVEVCHGKIRMRPLSIAIYIRQFWTTSKYLIADGYSSTTNGNRSQTAAKLESMIIDEGHAVGDGNRSQAAAIRESTKADEGHAVGDGNRS